MDEEEVLALIARGENASIEFKRELHLESADEKAEFVKDILSLANSAPNVGYLLVGVSNDKMLVGCGGIEEERIQQIAHTYVSPPLVIECHLVPTQVPGRLSVGVIAVRGTRKPHEVRQAIGRLLQDDVFVRGGSVVRKASQHEIKDMIESGTRLASEARAYTRAAKKHMGLRNWQPAIAGYSKAIEINPSGELFLARGNAYEFLARAMEKLADAEDEERADDASDPEALKACADKDYSDAIELAESTECEKEARLGRVRLAFRPMEAWQEDVDWLKIHTSGRELGEVLYWEVDRWPMMLIEPKASEAVCLLTQAIELGYRDPRVYQLRAFINTHGSHNYGLALKDIDEASKICEPGEREQLGLTWLRAEAQVGSGKLYDAFKTLAEDNEPFRPNVNAGRIFVGNFEQTILVRYALAHQLDRKPIPEPVLTMLWLIAIKLNQEPFPLPMRGSNGKSRWETELDSLEIWIPGIIRMLRGMFGEERWARVEKGTSAFSISFNP